MALTTLDPRSALIVVDLQRGLAAYPFAHPIAQVVAHSRRLADAFRRAQLPVVLVNVAGAAPGRTERPRPAAPPAHDWTELLPELGAQASDLRITKHTWGAFASSDLEAQLRSRGITQGVITGVATGTGVESAARQAYEHGFHVTLPIDAMTDMRSEAHDYSVGQVFPRLGETGMTAQVLELLGARCP